MVYHTVQHGITDILLECVRLFAGEPLRRMGDAVLGLSAIGVDEEFHSFLFVLPSLRVEVAVSRGLALAAGPRRSDLKTVCGCQCQGC